MSKFRMLKWMTPLLVLFGCLAFATPPTSGFDASGALSAETYPLGGLLTGTVGYGQLIWQDDESSTDTEIWKYGYVRTALEWKTSALTNRVTGLIEVFPISILGLSAGGGIDLRNYNKFSGIDCAQYMCNQALTFHFAQAQVIAGFGKFAAVATARYDWYRAQSSGRPFYDYMSYLVGRNGSDDLRSLTLLALYRENETWSFGALAIYQQMRLSESNNGSIYAVANYTHGAWQTTVGLGDYRSDHQVLRPSALFRLTYNALPSIGLLH